MSLGLKVLPSVLSQFAILHPETHVSVNLSDGFIDIVDEDYDLAIRISGPRRQVHDLAQDLRGSARAGRLPATWRRAFPARPRTSPRTGA